MNETEKIRAHIAAVLQTDSGRSFVAWLAVQCGFFTTSLTRSGSGEIAPLATECKEAQRFIYLEIRKNAPRSLIRAAEELVDKDAVPAVEEGKKSGLKSRLFPRRGEK